MDENDLPDDLPKNGGQHTFETDFEGQPPSIAIVDAIAAIEGVPSTDVDFALYESIDSEALDTLFADEKSGENIVAEFYVEDYVVQVRDDGKITVASPNVSE